MKATDLYEKYSVPLMSVALRNTATKALFFDLDKEMTDIMHVRNVKFDRGIYPIMRQQNDKWNALVRMFQKEFGTSPISENGFRKLWLHRMPQLKNKI